MQIEHYLKLTEKTDSEYLYVFYYPAYRELAMLNEVPQWPCKVGCSQIDPIVRVKQQLTASTPEMPQIGLLVHCDNAHKLETLVHNYLEIHQRKFDHEFNQEWFNTNPDEMVQIVKRLTARL